MKEQDAAHSFDKRTNSDRYIPTKQTDPDKVAASLRGKLRDANRELTRLRSELQQKDEKIVRLKNDLADALDVKNGNGPTALSMLTSELQQKNEVIKKMLPLAHRAKSGLWANDPYCGYVDETIEMAKESLKKQS